ncbi:hypothetical protein LTR17_007756 [Elasticomyces elasticus]|nr:hypothetical protein LTR17_007756 [Elasticomyces elasticus]
MSASNHTEKDTASPAKEPKVTWGMSEPKKPHMLGLAAFCENTARASAVKMGALPHKSTKRHGKVHSIQNHMTCYWGQVEGQQYERTKQGELFVDDRNTRVLEDSELDDNTKKLNEDAQDVSSNPNTWPY